MIKHVLCDFWFVTFYRGINGGPLLQDQYFYLLNRKTLKFGFFGLFEKMYANKLNFY